MNHANFWVLKSQGNGLYHAESLQKRKTTNDLRCLLILPGGDLMSPDPKLSENIGPLHTPDEFAKGKRRPSAIIDASTELVSTA